MGSQDDLLSLFDYTLSSSSLSFFHQTPVIFHDNSFIVKSLHQQPLSTAAKQPRQQLCTTNQLCTNQEEIIFIQDSRRTIQRLLNCSLFYDARRIIKIFTKKKIFLAKDITVQCSREYS